MLENGYLKAIKPKKTPVWLQTVEIMYLLYQGNYKITTCITIQKTNQPENQSKPTPPRPQ